MGVGGCSGVLSKPDAKDESGGRRIQQEEEVRDRQGSIWVEVGSWSSPMRCYKAGACVHRKGLHSSQCKQADGACCKNLPACYRAVGCMCLIDKEKMSPS